MTHLHQALLCLSNLIPSRSFGIDVYNALKCVVYTSKDLICDEVAATARPVLMPLYLRRLLRTPLRS